MLSITRTVRGGRKAESCTATRAGIAAAFAVSIASLICLPGAPKEAAARPRIYDVNILMSQPHPFANQPSPNQTFTTPPPSIQVRQPMRVPQHTPMPYTRPAASPQKREFRSVSLMGEKRRGTGILSELRIGGLIHDLGPFSSNEEGGFDVNMEVLFSSPDFLNFVWSPRPHVGGTINTEGDTSQFYVGLTWGGDFWRNWFWGFSLGGAVHDGELKTNRIDRKELGCTLLFRESIELGYRINQRHSISAMLDHLSNANVCSKNEGLENFGLRYGYRF